ncbi:hypothetical protein BDV09DRAFT_185927 [Aspergillus tetrazonus]
MKMKLILEIAVLSSLLPATIALSGPCKQSMYYCGSTLRKIHAHLSPFPPINAAALTDPRNALFECRNSEGELRLSSYCYQGCAHFDSGDKCTIGDPFRSWNI